ncbi:MAG: nodulation protein NfeD [Marinilabiliaceae bacterium]|nr:nodulation protein NfeD [Marinilabiliaceae bacterium]
MRSLFFVIFIFFGLCIMPLKADSGETEATKVVYVLPIFSNINNTSWIFMQRAFEEATLLDAEVIILHLNTYGGEVIFADSMRTRVLNSDIPVHVFIDNNAASAGALISIACKNIYMRPGANIGAATVVNQTGEEMPDKYQSYMRSTIRSTAEAHGKDTIVVKGDTIFKWKRDPKIAEAMVDERVVIPGLIDSAHVLTFTALEAIEHGFCEGLANNISEVITHLGIENPKIVTFKSTAFDSIKGFLTSPIFRGILILLIVGGIYFELQTPGVGFPLLAATIAAVLYFAPLYIDGIAENWEIALFLIGIVLIILEIFVFPGFGITGVLGIIFVIIGLTLSLIENVAFDFSGVDPSSFLSAMLTVICGIGGAAGVTILLSRQVLTQKSGIFSKVALHTTQEIDEGFVGVDASLSHLVGQQAVTATILRPAGKIVIDDELYDAKAVESFIEKGENVKVTSFTSGQLYVRKNF